MKNETRKKLKLFMDDARYIYNKTLEICKNKQNSKVNFIELRNLIVIRKDNEISKTDKIHEKIINRTPKDILAYAVKEYVTAHNNMINFAKTNKEYTKLYQEYIKINEILEIYNLLDVCDEYNDDGRNIIYTDLEEVLDKLANISYKEALIDSLCLERELRFIKRKNVDIHYRTKKTPTSGIQIPKTSIRCDENDRRKFTFYSTYKLGTIFSKEKIPEINRDCILLYNKYKDFWYIQVPYKDEKVKKIEKSTKWISCDPGLRTFLTCVDNNGDIIEYGKDFYKHIGKYHDKIASIDNIIDEIKGNRKYRLNVLRLKAQRYRYFSKIVNKVDNLHRQISKDLTDKYDLIILPKLKTSSILKYRAHEFNKRALCISHCKFHDYITMKASSLGKRVDNVSEHYTSKTCFSCGNMTDMKSSKTFSCAYCSHENDRDINAAFNILTKNLGSYDPALVSTSS